MYFLTLQVVIDLDTGEPKDEIQPLAIPYLTGVGCELTKPSEIAKQKPEGVMKKIQEGLDKANEASVSRAQKVLYILHGSQLGP